MPDLDRIIAGAEAQGAILGVAVRGPGGARFSHNGARRFVAASTVKIAVMTELFRRVDAGAESLEAVQTLRAEDKASGSGVALHLHDGIAFTLADLAYLMMSISDNSATNMLIDRLGMDRINATMRALGMAESTLGRRMRGAHAEGAEQENWALPDEYAALVAALLEGRAASAGACAAMVALLERQQNTRRIARHLPEGTRWGSKTGSLPRVCNDVGFVATARGPVILALFCEGLADPHAAEAVLGDVARAALDGVGAA